MKKHIIRKDDSFDRHLKQSLEEITKTISSKIPSICGMQGSKPDQILQLVFGLFQSLLSSLYLHVQFDNQLKELSRIEKESKVRENTLLKECQDLKERQRKRTLNHRNVSYQQHVVKRWRWIRCIIGFLTLGDLAFNYSSFQVISPNIAVGIVLALTLGTALIFLAHFSGVLIRKHAKTMMHHALYWSISLGLMSMIFYYIADLRLAYMTQMGGSESDVSSISLILLNLLFFTTASLLSFLYSPSHEDKLIYIQYKKDNGISRQEKKRIKAIEEELRLIPQEISEKKQLINGLLAFLKEQEKHIANLYEETAYKAFLDYSLHKGEHTKAPTLAKLPLQYQCLNLEENV